MSDFDTEHIVTINPCMCKRIADQRELKSDMSQMQNDTQRPNRYWDAFERLTAKDHLRSQGWKQNLCNRAKKKKRKQKENKTKLCKTPQQKSCSLRPIEEGSLIAKLMHLHLQRQLLLGDLLTGLYTHHLC